MLLGAYGCEKLHDWNQPEDPDTEFSSTYPLSGEWWVQYYFDNGDGTYSEVGFGYGHLPLFTYNTANNDGKEMWISDDDNFWSLKVKTPVDMKTLTFGGQGLVNNSDTISDEGVLGKYDISINITDGKVLKNAGKSPSGVTVDSIFMGVEYGDEPGTIFYIAGVRKTGFLEDEY